MKTREIFYTDPISQPLVNNGQARITGEDQERTIRELQSELRTFVCEGQYQDGLVRILSSYLGSLGKTNQPAAWVSGFFGSGKSHLLKMLAHLWQDTQFDDGTTARTLVPQMPPEVSDLLQELDTAGKRNGGLLAAAGALPSGISDHVRLTVVGIILKALGLPERYHQARFCLWLKEQDALDKVRAHVEDAGKDFSRELHNMYVSGPLAKAVRAALPDFAPNEQEAKAAVRAQFSQQTTDITTEEFLLIVKQALTRDGQIPCTVIVLDEAQQYIGDSEDRAAFFTEAAEALCKQLDSRVLLVASGQSALATRGVLQKLKDRFTIKLELSDADVETVTRKVLLQKKAKVRDDVDAVLTKYAGEVSRQLQGTRISERTEDQKIKVDDFPLLPARRRFWEHCSRAVDPTGTMGLLRTQLHLIHNALVEVGEKPLGHVIPADLLFDKLQGGLVQSQVLLNELSNRIQALKDGTSEGELKRRICGLVFLIRKLTREDGYDIGVRANADTLADLMISDLDKDGPKLREAVPKLLKQLVDNDQLLINLGDEYSLQTREGSEWEREFRTQLTSITSDPSKLATLRGQFLYEEVMQASKQLKPKQGKAQVPRKVEVHYDTEAPKPLADSVVVWVRDGWTSREQDVDNDAKNAGTDSAMAFAFVQRASSDDLNRFLATEYAAKKTIDLKGEAHQREGQEAAEGMKTRLKTSAANRESLIREIVDGTKVFMGGGIERMGMTLEAKLKDASEDCLTRLFPKFRDADSDRWEPAIKRAKAGDGDALQVVGYTGKPEDHPVCRAILDEAAAGKRGTDIRKKFEAAPTGWPRDAVDCALILLHRQGHIRATQNAQPVASGALDQAKIPSTDFRTENVRISSGDLLKLRGLFQAADIKCESDEVAAKAPAFLDHAIMLADSAGGPPPLPEAPSTTALTDIQGVAGNEQLREILNQHDDLKKQLKQWATLAKLKQERLPEWELVSALAQHGASLANLKETHEELEQVRAKRLLLADQNPLSHLRTHVASALRQALKQAFDQHESTYKEQLSRLEGSAEWGKLKPEQQKELLNKVGLRPPEKQSTSSDDDLLNALNSCGLEQWNTRTQALSQQASNALLEASRLLEPKVQSVHLSSGTLKDEKEVKAWLKDKETELLSKIKKGPIVIQ